MEIHGDLETSAVPASFDDLFSRAARASERGQAVHRERRARSRGDRLHISRLPTLRASVHPGTALSGKPLSGI